MSHKKKKKDGGIQLIAVGSTLRKLSVKVGTPVVQALGEELRPVQLGVSSSGGCEAAARDGHDFDFKIKIMI